MLRFLAPALLASIALAQNVYFSAALDGAQEVPPVATAGHGWSIVRLDTATNTVRIFLFHDALSGAPTAAHLHQGAVGVNGGVIVPLAPAGPNAFTGTGVLTPALATALSTGGTYVNVHTPANPGGEIRGQVVSSASTRFTGVLTGTQEVPPTGSAATGTMVAFLHEPENRLVYLVNSTGLVGVTAAHVHQGATGVSGPVIFPLNGGAGTYGGVSGRLTAAQVTALLANGMYANIHTSAFPGGEIRAQLLRDAGDHFVAVMNAASEVPPTGSPGQGGASLIVGVNGTIQVTGAFAGLTGPAIGAHVHFAPVGVNGGVVFPLTIAGTSLSGTFTPTTTDLTNLRAGNWYVNVHTSANPGGEIRGQLGPAVLPTTFGEGCLGSNAVRPQIGASGFPSVGSSMTIDLYGGLPFSLPPPPAPPVGLVVFAFGSNRDTALGLALPFELPVVGVNAPKCYVLIEPAATLALFTNTLGCASVTLNVPFSPALRGSLFYAQWFSFDAAANAGGLVPSSALTLPIQ